MCVGIIRNNSLVGGRARAESNAGHWARHALLHMAAEWMSSVIRRKLSLTFRPLIRKPDVIFTHPNQSRTKSFCVSFGRILCSRAWRAQWPGFDSTRARSSTKELFLIIPMHMMNREIIPGRKKEGSTVSSINCDRCRQLDLAVSSLPAALAWVEANRLGWPLVGVTHSDKLLTPTQFLLHPTLR